MGGSSSVRGDQTIYHTDNLCFDGTDRGAPMAIDGQLWIGATASNRADNGGHVRLGSLTSPDSTVTIGYSAPNITLKAVPASLPFTDEAVSFAAAIDNGYFCTAAITGTLPPTPAQGDTIIIYGDTASAVVVQANTGQVIRLGNTVSASAGTATSTARGDSLTLVFRTTGSQWCTVSAVGNWTVA